MWPCWWYRGSEIWRVIEHRAEHLSRQYINQPDRDTSDRSPTIKGENEVYESITYPSNLLLQCTVPHWHWGYNSFGSEIIDIQQVEVTGSMYKVRCRDLIFSLTSLFFFLTHMSYIDSLFIFIPSPSISLSVSQSFEGHSLFGVPALLLISLLYQTQFPPLEWKSQGPEVKIPFTCLIENRF